jgi:hypothetical protein
MTARTGRTCLGLILALFSFSAFAHADSTSTRAARLTYLQGAVTVSQPSNAESVPAQLNLPLLTGVQIATGNDGQAEVEFEDGSVVRLTPNTVLSLDNLAIEPDGTFVTNLSLLQGLAYCELRATPQYRYMLNAGGDILSPVENTTVRVNFDQPPAIFSVFDGTAQVERQGTVPSGEVPTAGYQTQVRAGESLSDDPADANRYFLTQQIAADSWDQWNDDRDQATAAEAADSTSVRNDYAGAEGYGWSDLDANGNWYDVPGQGPVWQPQVAYDDSNFDPYGNGAWVFYPNAGYVWASGYSWGWTPYRCGNWSFYGGFGWGWAPGSGCGGRGWGFAGGGRPVNIVVGPTGYHPIRVPVTGTPHPRPIMPVRTTTAWTRSTPPSGSATGPRQIAGVMAQPITRTGNAEPGGAAPGSTLRRDYPIDSSSKAPVMGLASTSPTAVHTNSGQRSTAPLSRPTNSQPPTAAPGQPEVYYGAQRYPSNGQPSSAPANTASRPEQGSRSQPSVPAVSTPAGEAAPVQTPAQRYPAASRPAEQAAPVQRPTQPAPSYQRSAPVERSSPPSASRPSYSPPPAASRPAPAPSSQSSGRNSPK